MKDIYDISFYKIMNNIEEVLENSEYKYLSFVIEDDDVHIRKIIRLDRIASIETYREKKRDGMGGDCLRICIERYDEINIRQHDLKSIIIY